MTFKMIIGRYDDEKKKRKKTVDCDSKKCLNTIYGIIKYKQKTYIAVYFRFLLNVVHNLAYLKNSKV